ncbi:MAG: glycosyltransferase [Candidatus Lokiarchaeota archaeon]|nr:glycosyltransferase [Candidatus Lokiarchaeota archaeon]
MSDICRLPRRVLVVDDMLNVGGKECGLLVQLQILKESSISTDLCLLRGEGELVERALEYTSDHLFLNRKKGRFVSVESLFRLRRYIIDKNIQIVHCNGWLDSLVVLIAVWGLRVSLVRTVHGHLKGFKLAIDRFVTSKFDSMIAVSNSFRRDLLRLGYKESNISVIPNTYDPCMKPSSTCIKPPPLRIISVGRLNKAKDQMTLVKAAKVLRSHNTEFVLSLIGTGSPNYIHSITRYLTENCLEPWVRMCGRHMDVATILRKSHLFVFPSTRESFGIALIEAMACGLPVIASRLPSTEEILENGEYGIMFEQGNYRDLANKIIKFALNHQLLEEYCSKSLKRASEYSPGVFRKRLLDVYRTVLT